MDIDDSYQGFPCIFMLSNIIDQVAMEVMFNEVKKKICVLKSKVFMSDMANAYSNAFEAVFGKPEHRLFCSWHVDKAWIENLSKIKTKEKKIKGVLT